MVKEVRIYGGVANINSRAELRSTLCVCLHNNGNRNEMTNFKSQITNKFQITIRNDQNLTYLNYSVCDFGCWDLGIVWNLGFGYWDLKAFYTFLCSQSCEEVHAMSGFNVGGEE